MGLCCEYQFRLIRVPYLPCLVNVFVSEADVGGGGSIVLVWNISNRTNLAPILRRLVKLKATVIKLSVSLSVLGVLNCRICAG